MSGSVTWTGGTHRISAPGVWNPHAPGPNDIAVVSYGHVIAFNQTLTGYGLDLEGTTPAAVTFDALGTTVDLLFGSFPDGFGNSAFAGTVSLLGANTVGSDGLLTAGDGFSATAPITLNLADVASATGVVIERSVLTNDGDVELGNVAVVAAPDAVFINNGTLGWGSSIDFAVYGTGTLSPSQASQAAFTPVTFEQAVGAGQTLDSLDSTIILADPLAFAATISGFADPDNVFGQIQLAAVTSASFIDHVLTLKDGSAVVAELRFDADTTAADIVIQTGPSGTTVAPVSNQTVSGNITVATTGTTPDLPPVPPPPPVATLPGTGPNVTLTSGAHVAAIKKLDGYTISLAGVTAASAPSVDVSSVTFGALFTLAVAGDATAAAYGSLAAVGYNENDGTIDAGGATDGGVATLAVSVTDVSGPDGVVVMAGAFNNVGKIAAKIGGTIDLSGSTDSKLINSGNVSSDGMVFIGPCVTGTGSMTVGTAAGVAGTLELGGYVATGQLIALRAGTLTIDHADHFFATIWDFNSHDLIELKGVDVTSVAYVNGALLLNGGADGMLHLHRPDGVTFTTASFDLHHSGGNTSITTLV